MNQANASQLSGTTAVSGVWYRALHPRFMPTLFATAHTMRHPTRFNAGRYAKTKFRTLYLAEDHMVALFEVQALLGSALTPGGIVPHPRSGPWTVLGVSVNFHRVADLTDTGEQAKIETTAQELTGDWRAYHYRSLSTSVSVPVGRAPTQKLGEEVFKLGRFEAVQTLSAKLPDRRILVVLPERMDAGSWVEFFDPGTGEVKRINGESWPRDELPDRE